MLYDSPLCKIAYAIYLLLSSPFGDVIRHEIMNLMLSASDSSNVRLTSLVVISKFQYASPEIGEEHILKFGYRRKGPGRLAALA